MAGRETVAVKGLAPLIRDFSRLSKELVKELRNELRLLAEPLARDVRERESEERFSPKTIRGIGIAVRQSGVFVTQRNRRTTGKRPDFGAIQMRTAFEPALDGKEAEIERGVEMFLDKIMREGA